MNGYNISERVLSVELSGIRKFFQAASPNSVNLTLGQPDFDTPQHIKDAAIHAIQSGYCGYTFNAGLPELRLAISDKLDRENSLSYTSDQVIVTAGAGEALYIALQSLVNPGDTVVYTDPGFVSYAECTKLASGRGRPLSLSSDLCIDIEQAKEAMDGARVFVLNSPSNPTGTVEPAETIRAIVEYADDKGVCVISDEVYEHFVYGDAKHVSAAQFGDNVLTINATSKTYAMTGWRLGFVAGPSEYIDQCIKVHQYCQTCATSISQYAALAAYTGDQSCVTHMKDVYERRRDLVYDGLTRLGFTFKRPEGAFYAFAPMASLFSKLVDAGVVGVPGDAFGKCGAPYVRFSYAAADEVLSEAIRRIGTIVSD
ncbi:MAG: pyridoxal phosphate-dependent aminotransferase [Methanomicrobiales archaeon]|nr:pyridoxal phosphate-dependent aminotransferase [Methanomicrobiales archaeon]